MSFIWQAFIVLGVGFFLLRIIGKKSVSEMTGPEIVTLLSMGSVIGHAISENELWKTIITLCIFGFLLIIIQFLALKFNWIEGLFMGKSTLLVQDGKLNLNNLKKLRMTVDQLETKLREKGISTFADVKTATIEMSGHLGYELQDHAKPVTIGDLEQLLSRYNLIPKSINQPEGTNLFEEVLHGQHRQEIPRKLD